MWKYDLEDIHWDVIVQDVLNNVWILGYYISCTSHVMDWLYNKRRPKNLFSLCTFFFVQVLPFIYVLFTFASILLFQLLSKCSWCVEGLALAELYWQPSTSSLNMLLLYHRFVS
jgi:hypothetical protein